jgi:hypothetical protein
MTPYEIVYRQQPLIVTSYLPGTKNFQAIDKLLQGRESTLTTLNDNLHMAQNCMKQEANQHHSESVFQEGDQVFL